VLSVEDEESGIKSISAAIYDTAFKFDVWTTTQEAERLAREHTDEDLGPEAPEAPTNPERLERVRHWHLLTSPRHVKV